MSPISRRVRAFLSAEDVWRKASTGIQAVIRGVALGLLDHRHLAQLDEIYYSTDALLGDEDGVPYPDEEYIRSGLFDWEERAIRRHFPAEGRIVLTAAGSGRELLWLVQNGYEVFAYEPNDGLREAGNAVLATCGVDARVLPCERDEFPADAPECDAVVIGWGSFTLIAGAERRARLLAGARARLPHDGRILLSYWNRERLNGALAASFLSARAIRRLRGAEPVDPGDFLHPHFVHYVSDREAREALRSAGFEAVEVNRLPYAHAIGRAIGSAH